MTDPADNNEINVLKSPGTNRILLIGVTIGLLFLLVFTYLAAQYVKTAEQQRLINLKQKVEIARNSIEPILMDVRANRISGDVALGKIRDSVRRMTFTDHTGDNYIFMSSYDGIMLVQPFEPGKEMSNVRDLKDSYGVFIIRELIKKARSTEQKGYVTYHYRPPSTPVPQEKISYVVGIPELGCYIGTGAYMGDIRLKEKTFRNRTASLITILLTLLFLLVYFSKKEILTRNLKLKKENEEHRKTEKKLRESEERYRMLIENANDAIFYFGFSRSGLPTEFLDVNSVACKRYGYTKEEILGMCPVDLAPEESHAFENNAVWNLDSGKSSVFETVHVNKNGKKIPVEISLNRIETNDGKFAIIVARDMTERNQKEEALRLTQFSTENASLGIFWFNGLDGIVYANKQACRMLGYSLEELKKLNLTAINPNFREEVTEKFFEKLRDKKNLTIEENLSHRDGTTFPAAITTEYAEYDGRELLFAYVRDISERKRAERDLRLTQYAVDNSATPIIRFNADSSIIYANLAACRRLGYSREEFLGLTIPDIDAIWTRDYWEKEGIAWLRKNKISNFESVNMHKDGSRFPVEVLCYDAEFEGQEHFYAFVTDITERKQTESRQIESQKMEALGTLAGGIAHDFNNILSGIFGYTQMTARITEDNPKAQKYLHQVHAASERATALVQQILTFSRQDKSQMQPLDMVIIVKEALKLIRASLPANIEIRHDRMPQSGTILADPVQIHQVVMNLCTNAYHAMKETGGILRVDLLPIVLTAEDMVNHEEIPAGKYLELVVSDNGHGIAPHILSRIFEPYFTTKEIGTGTGMGLSAVHGIVKNHGGAIKIASEAGTGTTARVLFPEIEQEAPVSMEIAEPLARGNEHVLLVDDEKALVQLGAEFLGSLGYTVETCTSSVAALDLFKADPDKFHLVITDLTMPVMTGDVLAREIKIIRPGIPIILCTGFSSTMLNENQNTSDIDCILMKPLNILGLSKTIQGLLDSPG